VTGVPGDLLVHLRRARDHTDRHYTEPLDLDTLAGVVGLSREGRRVPPGACRPAVRVEAVCRDNSGNCMVLVEPREYTGEDVEHA
jgi:hypothetical protein